MSADLLRRAAKAMRARAEAATPGRWVIGPSFAFPTRVISEGKLRPIIPIPGDPWAVPSDVADTMHRPNAEHIASWHPAVALAVADSLDRWAELARADIDIDGTVGGPEAVALARAFLGVES